MKTELFIFDMGDVLVWNGVNFHEIAEFLGVDAEAFDRDYERYDIPMMEGWMDTLSYMRHLENEFGVKIDGNLFSEIYHPEVNLSILPVLEYIRKMGGRTVIGSNTFAPHVEVISKLRENLFSYFDAVYFSHEMHITKPSLSFFRYILDSEGIPACSSFFVDDRSENVKAAVSLGIRSFLYSGERNAELTDKVKSILA